MRLFERNHLAAACALLALLTASCAGAGGDKAADRKVSVRSLATDVGLGKAKTLRVAPPNVVVGPDAYAPPAFSQPPKFDIPPLPGVGGRKTQPTIVCPLAESTATPKRETTGVSTRPTPGMYRWSFKVKSFTVEYGETSVPEFIVPRVITNIADDPIADGAFTYDMVDTFTYDVRSGSVVSISTTYRVIPVARTPEANLPVPNNDVQNTSKRGGAGVYLMKITTRSFEIDPTTGQPEEAVFQPNPPLQILNFPTTSGMTFDTTGVDPASGSSLQIKSKVIRQRTFDACGSLVRGWFVEGEQIFRAQVPDERSQVCPSPDNCQGGTRLETFHSKYDYAIANNLGGALIYQHIETPIDGPVTIIDAKLGELKPAG